MTWTLPPPFSGFILGLQHVGGNLVVRARERCEAWTGLELLIPWAPWGHEFAKMSGVPVLQHKEINRRRNLGKIRLKVPVCVQWSH